MRRWAVAWVALGLVWTTRPAEVHAVRMAAAPCLGCDTASAADGAAAGDEGRAAASERVEARAGCKGKLRVTTVPRARVAVGGVGLGVSPTKAIALPEGRYEVEITHRLLGSVKRLVHVACRDNQHLQVRW